MVWVGRLLHMQCWLWWWNSIKIMNMFCWRWMSGIIVRVSWLQWRRLCRLQGKFWWRVCEFQQKISISSMIRLDHCWVHSMNVPRPPQNGKTLVPFLVVPGRFTLIWSPPNPDLEATLTTVGSWSVSYLEILFLQTVQNRRSGTGSCRSAEAWMDRQSNDQNIR